MADFTLHHQPPKKHKSVTRSCRGWMMRRELEEQWPEASKVHKQIMVSVLWFSILYSSCVWFRILVSPYDSVSAIESSACLVFGWLAKARRSKTSHGDGGFVIAKAATGGKSSKSDGQLFLKWFNKVISVVFNFTLVSHARIGEQKRKLL